MRSDNVSVDEFERPYIPLRVCEYNKRTRVLRVASDFVCMSEIFIESHHTGRVVRFVPVGPDDVLYDEDGWDGEQQVFRPCEGEFYTNVDHLVVYNPY